MSYSAVEPARQAKIIRSMWKARVPAPVADTDGLTVALSGSGLSRLMSLMDRKSVQLNPFMYMAGRP